MKKRSLSVVALSAGCLLMTGCLMLAGCGNKNTAEPASTAESAAETVSTQEESLPAESALQEETETQSLPEETPGQAEESPATEAATPVRVMALKGPTAMGMVQMMNAAEKEDSGSIACEFTLAASPDEVTPGLAQGNIDIAAVPANLAAVLYQNMEHKVQVLAVNTLGVLYLVENGDTVASVSDLAGKTIYASGKGSTPEYALNYVLSENGIDPEKDVTIEWKSEHSECVAAILAEEGGVAMLPQPFVTTAQMKNDSIRTALDLTREWEALQTGAETPSAMITGVVVVRSAFAAEHKDAVNAFLDSYRESVDYVNAHVEDAAALIENYDIVPAAVAQKALPACNITFMEGEEMQEKLSGYLQVLFDQNPKAVGGDLPGEDFYYKR